MILEFEESNGNLVNPITNGYSFGQWELFNDIIYYQSSYFVGGRYTYAGGGTANMRPSFSKFDANGDELFSKMYMVPEGQTARLYTRDVTLHNNNFVHLIAGDINGNSVTNVPFYVMQTDDQGTPIWLKEIDIQQMNGPWEKNLFQQMMGI